MAQLDLAAAVAEMDRRLKAEESLHEFLLQAWPQVEEGRAFVDGWHIQAICEHLEAVTRGEIRDLLINIPPRMSKSTTVAVIWPAWSWIAAPSLQWVFTSYAQNLSMRDSVRCRRLMESAWFRARWGDRFSLVGDQNTKIRFDNDHTGYRIASSVDGMNTGEGGDFIICDDPNNVKDQSDTMLDSTTNWWTQVMPTRMNDFKTGRRVVIQQRVHEKDLSGHILSDKEGWVHLRLPMEYEEKKPCVTVKLPSTNGKRWRDPRLHDGDLLCAERIGPPELKKLKKDLQSEYAVAGQLQQRPAPSEGGIIKKIWFQPWKQSKRPETVEWIIQSWDTADSEKKKSAYSCCHTYGVFKTDKGLPAILLLSRWRGRVEYPELRRTAKLMSEDYMDDDWKKPREKRNPKNRPNMILIESKSTGRALIADFARASIFATPFNPDRFGDKRERVRHVSHLMEAGTVWVPYAAPTFERPLNWVDQYLMSMATFPNAESRDDVDVLTMTLQRLIMSGWVFHPEDDAAKPKKKFAEEHREAIY
jgi:phage terminase large subunit-like protein